MLLPTARIFVPQRQSVVSVHPGSLIGRLTTAAIHIPHPRISEAHALVSLRGNRLKLLALRGKLRCGGEAVRSVLIEQGAQIELAEGVLLFVEDVYIPPSTLMLCGVKDGPIELVAATYSLIPDADSARSLRLVPEYVDGAGGYLWVSAGTLWIGQAGAEPEMITVGRTYSIGRCVIQVINMPLSGTIDTVTNLADPPLEDTSDTLVVTARYTSVHIHHRGNTCVISGRPANLISELVRFGGKPVPWEVVAQEIWGGGDRMQLRQNLDRTLQRLRERLRETGIREGLVAPDGTGNLDLVLQPGDRLLDET